MMNPVFFSSPDKFQKWLEKYHDKEKELLVGYWKVKSGKPSMSWSESVDEALCYGWIDGVRRSIDEESYMKRFTPRRPSSIWSAVNIKKMDLLIKEGRMKPTGLAAYSVRKADKSAIYAYENEPVKFSEEFETELKANKKAFSYFNAMPNSYKKVATNWVMSAKHEKTRIKRMNELINDSANGMKIKTQRY